MLVCILLRQRFVNWLFVLLGSPQWRQGKFKEQKSAISINISGEGGLGGEGGYGGQCSQVGQDGQGGQGFMSVKSVFVFILE